MIMALAGMNSKHYCFFLSLLFFSSLSMETDTIFPGQSLSGNQTISSDGGTFELGFFTPGKSSNYYIGIWYKKAPNKTVVWVANRDHPLSNSSSSSLQLSRDGRLILLNQSRTEIWSTDDHVTSSSSVVPNSTIAVLLDNGNLILRQRSNSSDVLWQSFDHPTDTWLPGGKIGESKNGKGKTILTPWKNPENPGTGIFSVEVEPNGTSHILLWNGTKMYWTSGEWTGKHFVNVPEIDIDYYIKNFRYVETEKERYFTYDAAFPTFNTRFLLDYTGQLKQFVWGKNFEQWAIFWTKPPLQCEVYGFCGGFSSCNSQKEPLCECLQGFEPASVEDWELKDYSGGCARKTPLQCLNDTYFLISNTYFPADSENLTVSTSEECEKACSSDCSCTGYADDDNGCLIWKGALFNLRKLQGGKQFFARIAASERLEIGTNTAVRSKTGTEKLIWILAIGGFGILFLLFVILLVVFRQKQRRSGKEFEAAEDSLVLFKYRDLRKATKNFSEKLGEGGFGSVYKGMLNNSTIVAVKKLKNLTQGEKQFRSEVSSIGTIQHINLVRLRGFCAEPSKRCLVFDYMPNGSIEHHLFDKSSNILDWKARYNIALGAARGLAYLHEKCRDCIIHCDIKPENILLDASNNPKVADFGLAKLVGRDFSRVLTTMRGTRGYLAPEWLSGEAITPKADVFSYGMLLFEIVSGRRNRDRLEDGTDDYFPMRVVDVINNGGDVMSLLDDRLEGNAAMEEVNRACRVACWCIQDYEKDRPTMGQIVQVLEGLSELGTPPMPRILQGLTEKPGDAAIEFLDASSGA